MTLGRRGERGKGNWPWILATLIYEWVKLERGERVSSLKCLYFFFVPFQLSSLKTFLRLKKYWRGFSHCAPQITPMRQAYSDKQECLNKVLVKSQLLEVIWRWKTVCQRRKLCRSTWEATVFSDLTDHVPFLVVSPLLQGADPFKLSGKYM
jgi:hypothetical protein